MTAADLSEEAGQDPREGLSRRWWQVPGTRLYLGPRLAALLPMLYVIGWLGAYAVYVFATLLHGGAIRQPTVLDGLARGRLFMTIQEEARTRSSPRPSGHGWSGSASVGEERT